MKNIFIVIILLFCFPVGADDFNYNLDFRGFDVPLLAKMGCTCETQEQFDFFYESYTRQIAGELHFELKLSAGILKKNTWAAKGFMGTYNNVLLSNWINSEPTKSYDSMVIFVNWPEFGDL